MGDVSILKDDADPEEPGEVVLKVEKTTDRFVEIELLETLTTTLTERVNLSLSHREDAGRKPHVFRNACVGSCSS